MYIVRYILLPYNADSDNQVRFTKCILYSGGAAGVEELFGDITESFGIEEVNYSFEGHQTERVRGVRVLTSQELTLKDVSLTYVSKLMRREYTRAPLFRKVPAIHQSPSLTPRSLPRQAHAFWKTTAVWPFMAFSNVRSSAESRSRYRLYAAVYDNSL